MRIVIITDVLARPLYTARVRFVNQQLLAAGHQVSWFAEKSPDTIPDDILPANLVEIPYYESAFDRFFKAPLILLADHKNRFFARNIKPTYAPDLVFVSTFHTFGLRAGLCLAHRYNCPLHIDLRDIAEQTPANSYSRPIMSVSRIYRAINIHRRNKVLRQANTITTVSRFQQKLISSINANTHIIYNGYDATIFKPEDKLHDGTIRIVYAGRWYGKEMQDPTPLFTALQKADFKYILVFYTGTEVHDELSRLARQYGVEIELHDYVCNSEVPKILNQSDVALVLTSPSNRGILTTKFFEALGTRTPVLCVPSDRGELANLIRTTKAGLASADSKEILDFLRNPHCECDNPDLYSRQHQTEKLINLFQNNG